MILKKSILSLMAGFAILLMGAALKSEEPPSPQNTTSSSGPIQAESVGATACLACHADQESFKQSIHARNMMKKKGIEFEQSCETCHGPGSLHSQAAGDRSNPGFATVTRTQTAAEATCLECHNNQKRLHWASSVHNERNVTCNSCHSIHGAKSAQNLLQEKNERENCFKCHQNIKAELRRNSHMPVMEGKMTCSDCHNPHGSATNKMLVADSANQLCFNCHAEKRGPFLWIHAPVQENCLTCHVPHGSHTDKMLVAKLPMLCQRCHFNSGHNNRAYDKVRIDALDTRTANKSCVNCHSNIHGSNHPSGKDFQR